MLEKLFAGIQYPKFDPLMSSSTLMLLIVRFTSDGLGVLSKGAKSTMSPASTSIPPTFQRF